MDGVVALVGITLIVLIIVLPITAMVTAARARRSTDELLWRISRLESRIGELDRHGASIPPTGGLPAPEPAPVPEPEPAAPPHAPPPPPKLAAPAPAPPVIAAPPVTRASSASAPPPTAPAREFDWEQFLGVKLFAWLAGLAALFGAVFGLKYSVEHGWVPPAVRAAFGFLAGAGALAGGFFAIRRRFEITGQALCATGVVILYSVTFACKALYRFEFFSTGPTFAVMVLITVTAFLLAVRLPSQTVAILGFFGGFLTPVLVSSGFDNPVGLFGYIALLDMGLLAVALHRRWHYLALLAALGTAAMQIGWAEAFFSVSRLPTAVTVGVFFVALFAAAAGVAWRRGEQNKWVTGSAFIPPALAIAFALYFISLPGAAARPAWIFALVLVADIVALALVLMDPAVARAHVAAALAAFATTAVWIGAAATTELLPWALGFVVLLGALHACFPFALRRVQPGYVAGGWSGALCCLGLVVLLVPVLSMDDVGVWMWPVVLLLDLIVLAAAAASGILLALAGAVALTFLTLGAAILRSPAVHVDAQAGTLELWLVAGFASLFCAASVWLLRRADARFAADGIRPPAWTRHLPGLSGATPFALLVMLIFKLGPPNPGEIFGVAFLLALLLLGITALARQGMLALAAFLGCLIVEYTWFNGWFRAGEHGAALAGFAIFAALFLGFPFVMRRRILDIQMPWAVAALSLPLHFILLRGGIDAVWPNDIPGVLAMLFALPLVAGLILLLRWIPADAGFRLNRLAWFAGAALFFVTLVFPLQFQKHWITIGWALEGAALLWLFHRLPHPGLRLTGIALLVAVFIRLTFNPAIFDYAPRGEHPILNWILYTYGIAAAACFAGMRLLAPPQERVLSIDARALVGAMGTVLAFVLMNLEIADYFSPAGSALHLSFSGNLPRDMSYTIAWSLFALALLVIGISRGIRAARYAAIALLGVALLKLFIHDLARLDQLYRVAAFIAVAVIAFAASFLFQRFLRRTDKEQR